MMYCCRSWGPLLMNTTQVPSIKVVVYNDDRKQYCGQEPTLGGSKAQAGYWFKFNIPMEAFK